jgi:phosphate transport system substrate-binding protein
VKRAFSFFSFAILLAFFSCRDKVASEPIENINKGSVTILCDKDFEYVMRQHEEVYEGLYPGTDIIIEYKSDNEILAELYDRKRQIAILGRKLTEKERKDLQRIDNIIPREHFLAKDALVLISSKSSNIVKLKQTDVIKQFGSAVGENKFVFESKQSGLINSFPYFSQSTQFFGVDSMPELVAYLEKNPSAVGLISYARISDEESIAAQNLLKKVNVIALEITDSTGLNVISKPCPADLYDEVYPFIRNINFVLLNPKERVGKGFVNYLNRQRGSKLFLNAGLIPTRMPERDYIVNFK